MSSTLVRRAERGDARFLAWAILTAARSHLSESWFDVALGGSESECLAFLRILTTSRTRSQWHYSGFLIAEGSIGPVSALFAARAGDIYATAPMAILESLKLFSETPEQRAKFWERAAPWFTCALRPEAKCLALENVATLPTHRGRGYTAALLARAFDDGRGNGLKEAQITCMIGNDSAERAYKRAGFRFVTEWRHPDFEKVAGTPGMRKFSRAL